MTDHTPTIKTKKPLYTGDPNAKLTICGKKLRRHLAHDLMYVPVAVENSPTESGEVPATPPPVQLIVLCKHCKQDPVIYQEPSGA